MLHRNLLMILMMNLGIQLGVDVYTVEALEIVAKAQISQPGLQEKALETWRRVNAPLAAKFGPVSERVLISRRELARLFILKEKFVQAADELWEVYLVEKACKYRPDDIPDGLFTIFLRRKMDSTCRKSVPLCLATFQFRRAFKMWRTHANGMDTYDILSAFLNWIVWNSSIPIFLLLFIPVMAIVYPLTACSKRFRYNCCQVVYEGTLVCSYVIGGVPWRFVISIIWFLLPMAFVLGFVGSCFVGCICFPCFYAIENAIKAIKRQRKQLRRLPTVPKSVIS